MLNNIEIEEEYYYVTIHRPYNTDDKERLYYVLNSLNILKKKVIMSVHPRTANLMNHFEFKKDNFSNISFIDPQSYFNNLSYLGNSIGLITDSGGMQKEAYWLEKKCITIRKETEWIETLKNECNTLLFEDLPNIQDILNNTNSIWNSNLYGDGNSCKKIVEQILIDLKKN